MERFNLGVVAQACGESERAIRAYRSIARDEAEYSAAQNNLAVIAAADGRWVEARNRLDRARGCAESSRLVARNLAVLETRAFVEDADPNTFASAELQLRTMLLADPTSVRTRTDLGHLYYERALLGDRASIVLAEVVLADTAELDQSAAGWNLRGLIALYRGRPTVALWAFEHATELDPTAVVPHLNAAHVLLRVRAFDRAVEHLRAIDVSVNDPHAMEVWLALGRAHHGLGEFDAAAAAFERARAWDPSDARPDFNLGILYADWGGQIDTDGLAQAAVAKQHLERFLRRAAYDTRYGNQCATADARLTSLDAWLHPRPLPRCDEETRRLEETRRAEQARRRAELLDLERRAKEALKASGGESKHREPADSRR